MLNIHVQSAVTFELYYSAAPRIHYPFEIKHSKKPSLHHYKVQCHLHLLNDFAFSLPFADKCNLISSR